MGRRWTAALTVLSALAGPASAAQAPDPAAVMKRIMGFPYHYGGALQGTVPGAAASVDRPPDHLSMGLSAPAPDSTLHGEAILFTADRQLVATGTVSGRLVDATTPGTGACFLRLELPAETVTLTGLCTADTLSGEIIWTPHPGGLVARLVSWWGDRAVAGRYWLTPASFDPPNHGDTRATPST